jgi:hypothetical protein
VPFGLRWASGCSPAPAPGPRSHATKATSHELAPSFRVPRASSGRPTHRLPRGQTVQPGRLPSLRFSAPSASPRSQQQHDGRVCLARPLALSGFLDLSAPSSAVSLPALFHAGSALGVVPFRALLLPCSRTPSPAPLPSCRCSHLSKPEPPHDLGRRSSFRRAGPATQARRRRNGFEPRALRPPKRPSCPDDQPRRGLLPKQPAQNAARSTSPDIHEHLGLPPNDDPALQERPRLQGFAPHESPPLEVRLFRPGLPRVALLGLPPFRAVSLAGVPQPSPRLPSWTSLSQARTTTRLALQGFAPSEVGWTLSSLPTLMGFCAS